MGPYNPYNFGIPAYGYNQFTQPQTPMQQEPSIKVPQVHGENDAKAYSLPPNLGEDDGWRRLSNFERLSDCSNR